MQLFFRNGTAAALLAIAGLAFGGGTIAEAQSAVFSGAVVVLGSGFSFDYGVAVDAGGNVFVADTKQ